MKDKLYWQVYNQKRKGYLTLKKRESRKRIKAQSTTSPWSTTSQEGSRVVDLINHQPTDILRVVDQVVDCLVVDRQDNQVVDRASKVVDNNRSPVVDSSVVDNKPKLVVDRIVDHPILRQLFQTWKTNTNYSCPSTCAYSYCNNCWYFSEDELIDYKEVSV